MAMTKRMRVSFSLGAVLLTENVENFKKTLCELSRKVLNGEKTTGFERKMVEVGVTEGLEAVVELVFKKSIVDSLKEDLSNYSDQPSFGNFRVEFER
ncbi:Gp5.5-like host HNS inhibition [Escherichia phage K1F]|uniref:Gp5.5 protein n=1 Tax=Escherichia phage K1F TaxID=344021 RepID=Q2WC87_BPK1F|nr:Gp5.5-like host HNS inhibition [Escherichia phage K1F]CAJ29373.1 gp5.5 protein [Escherichia phage K1F]